MYLEVVVWEDRVFLEIVKILIRSLNELKIWDLNRKTLFFMQE